MKYVIILHKNNREYIIEEYPNLVIETDDNTKDNIIHVYEGVHFIDKTMFLLRSIRGNYTFGRNCVFEQAEIRTGPGCFEQNLDIGANSYFEKGTEIILNTDFCSCTIGDACYFERNIGIWAGDGHAIINKTTMHADNCGEYAINVKKGVLIGHNSVLLKRASIGEESVVKCNSLITKDFSDRKNLLLGGMPAKVLNENIIWRNR